MAGDSAWIAQRAKALGFDLCGVVRAEKFAELKLLGEWLERGYAGEMRYLEDPRRSDLSLAMPDVRSVIVCALNYNTTHPYSTEAAGSAPGNNDGPRGWISRYAWGDDYHEVMWSKLNALTAALREKFPEPFSVRGYADTGPIAERVLAKHAGLGWLGKNTLLLNEKLGSWLFLGVILTSLDLEPSVGPAEVPRADLCGNCRQCLDACPTGALVEPYVLDARRCISYLTIELRGEIPGELRDAMGWQVYGCDICQDVCPFNQAAPATNLPEFQPRQNSVGERLLQPKLEWLAALGEDEFRKLFRGNAMKRAKWAGLVRNACIALGNSHVQPGSAEFKRIQALLEKLTGSPVSTIADSARWALSRIKQERD
jgi:epoxyqueuosine reductase